jgi:glycosyltransferase involved in cell wall biosynthesis
MLTDSYQCPVLVGRPLDCTGRGEDIRCSFRAFREVGVTSPICENYPLETRRSDPDIEEEFTRHLVARLSRCVNIFYMNGDEVKPTLAYFGDRLAAGAHNIICPQWELSMYPEEWAKQLERFDEIWAPSRFVFDSIRKAVSNPVFHLPLSTEIRISSFLGRRYFGLPESAYLFLFYFDFRSYIHRKNPFAIMKAFEEVCRARPHEDIRLVLKLSRPQGPSLWKADFPRFMNELERCQFRNRLIVIDKIFTENEIRNLIRCCDCFGSLHRSEGYGRGLAEAMFLGKPVIATGYSGNLDFMNQENSCLVRYDLTNVKEGTYPHAKGQVWAEPDIDHAVGYMLNLLDDRDWGRKLGAIASQHIRTYFSYRATGLKYQKRLEEIARCVA